MQLKRPVQRRPEGGERGDGTSEESLAEKKDEHHVGEPEQRLAERDRQEAIAGQEAERRERVRVERGLVEDVGPAPPSIPGLGGCDLPHPRRVLMHGFAPEQVATNDMPRPLVSERHVGLGSTELVLRHGEP